MTDSQTLHHSCIPGIIPLDCGEFDLQYFVEDFCIYVHQRYWPGIFFSLASLSSFIIRIILASLNKRKNLEEFSSLLFLGRV